MLTAPWLAGTRAWPFSAASTASTTWSGILDRFASVSLRTVPPSRQVRRSSRDSYWRSRPCLSVCRLLILTTCIAVGCAIITAS
jgi:hypothetical protein